MYEFNDMIIRLINQNELNDRVVGQYKTLTGRKNTINLNTQLKLMILCTDQLRNVLNWVQNVWGNAFQWKYFISSTEFYCLFRHSKYHT